MKRGKVFKTMDANEAAAYASYAFTECAAIYPITPSSPMADHVDEWAAHGRKNIFGYPVRLVEMQAESGACAALQGSLEAGSLTTTYTSSQGLMLMIPPMYRIAGVQLPGVMHVAARVVSTSSICILGDHSDVMACRQTGWAQLASSSVQEAMDLGAIAHLSALRGSVPVQHFFEGFRTSHEIQKIEVLDYDDLAGLLDYEALGRFRASALNPEHPTIRHCGESDDTLFQHRESCNPIYDAFPDVVKGYMDDINRLTGRDYRPFNYYGAPDAERVVIAMGSVCETLREVTDYLMKKGEKVGFIQVHLYRPFSVRYLTQVLPDTVRSISALDRTKEPGSVGEPLYTDLCAALAESGRNNLRVLGGRYGIACKDTTPAQMKAVFDNMAGEMKNHFTVGIEDDVTHTSLPVGDNIVTAGDSIISCKFWGLGSDGTVGANKSSIKIIGDHTDQYVQAYFQYDAKKSGGVTRSHLRFGHEPIRSAYYVTQADFLACHKQSYVRSYDMVNEIRPGGTFLLNTHWDEEELEKNLPNRMKRLLAERHINFYTIDATKIAEELGLGNKTSMILQAAFFKLSGVLPMDEAVQYMKEEVEKTFSKKGEKIVSMNQEAIDLGLSAARPAEVKAEWAELKDEEEIIDESLPEYVRRIMIPVNNMQGDLLPVSVFADSPGGIMKTDTARYERRGVADNVPVWDMSRCIGCNRCSLACPHAAIRPFLLSDDENADAPEGFPAKPLKKKGAEGLSYSILVDVLDCQGCGSCVNVCPAKEKALRMEPLEAHTAEMEYWDYGLSLSEKQNPFDRFTPVGSQYEQPLYEFSGACPGCGETPYIKLVTQLFGDRLYVANATGCTQAVGFFYPSFPQAVTGRGYGPAFSNSLFENNAEFAYGISISVEQMRRQMKRNAETVLMSDADKELREAVAAWLADGDREETTVAVSDTLREVLARTDDESAAVRFLKDHTDCLTRKAIWMYGGDGWAYDIGYGGLDHVLASGTDLNVLIVDTEVYSNTGGQASKATPIGAVAEFAAGGKTTPKKDLGRMLFVYGYVYVAQISLGADPAHAIRCLKEAAEYEGPSVIIAYAPCLSHGISGGMGWSMVEEKKAVECGYWPLYHFDPRREERGENPFVLDSGEPDGTLLDFMMSENRFAALTRTFPDTAKELFAEAEKQCMKRYRTYRRLAQAGC